MAKHQGRIVLGGLTELKSPKLAALLAAHRPSYIMLNKLTDITPEVVHELVQANCSLGLAGLSSISEDVAAELGQHSGILTLTGLQTLSEKSARHLIHHEENLRLGKKELFSPLVLSILESNTKISFQD